MAGGLATQLNTLLQTSVSTLPLRPLLLSLRPHQWVKNVLVFGALIFSQSLLHLDAVLLSSLTFVSFCLASSAVYLLNDLRDLEEDRFHPKKKHRPLASGQIRPSTVKPIMVILAAGAIALAFAIRTPLMVILLVYLILNVAYTMGLKHVVILDVMILAMGFVLRAVAGALALAVPVSPWIVLCTLTLALLIGSGKRRHELALLGADATRHRASLEGYTVQFLDSMMTISAGAAVVCYALYTMAEETQKRVGSHGLVLTTPFVIYGIFRFLYLLHKQSDGSDPARLFISDVPMLLNAALWVLVACAVMYGPSGWIS